MQDRPDPSKTEMPVARPATIGEVVFEDDLPDELDDRLVLLGGVLLATGWDAEVELADLPVPSPALEVDDPDDPGGSACGAPVERADDEVDLFEPVVTVTGIQQRLVRLGFHDGPPTGVLDAETRAALWRLQAAASLPATGLPDGPTRDALVARFGW